MGLLVATRGSNKTKDCDIGPVVRLLASVLTYYHPHLDYISSLYIFFRLGDSRLEALVGSQSSSHAVSVSQR